MIFKEMEEREALVRSLETYLEGLEEQILYHVQRIEELHALRLEMAQIKSMLHKIEQGCFEYEWEERESRMDKVILRNPVGRPRKKRLFLERSY